MSKNGQARVLSNEQLQEVLAAIEHHRYPAKNAAIVQVSFKLGLRVQELSLLRLREVCQIGHEHPAGYAIKEVLTLPRQFTKGARARKASPQPDALHTDTRTSVRFSVKEFADVVRRIAEAGAAGNTPNPVDYYPPEKKAGGQTRELPISDTALRAALARYLDERALSPETFTPNAPLFLSQKGGAYNANTLQDHMATMYRRWAGIERATSHSGRRTLATRMLGDGEHLRTVQKVLGHKSAATTVIYDEVTEQELGRAMRDAGESYERKPRR